MSVDLFGMVGPGFGLLGVFWLVNVVLFIWALINVIGTPMANSTNKLIWVLVILFLPLLGSLLWLLWGKNQETA